MEILYLTDQPDQLLMEVLRELGAVVVQTAHLQLAAEVLVELLVPLPVLLEIPGRPPFDYYSADYERGLQLYSAGVMIMDNLSCSSRVTSPFFRCQRGTMLLRVSSSL